MWWGGGLPSPPASCVGGCLVHGLRGGWVGAFGVAVGGGRRWSGHDDDDGGRELEVGWVGIAARGSFLGLVAAPQSLFSPSYEEVFSL